MWSSEYFKKRSKNSPIFVGVGFYFAVLLVLSSLVIQNNGERILFIYPFSSKSMANLFDPLARGLLDRGHQLTIAGSVPIKVKSPNLTQITAVTADEFFQDYPEPFEVRKQRKLFRFPVPVLQKFCHQLYNHKEFSKLTSEKFDLIIANIFYQDCFAGLMHKIGSPIILFGTLPAPSAMLELYVGNHQPSSFIPITFGHDISAPMTFIQRTKNFLYNAYFSIMMEWWTHPRLEEIYRKYLGQETPSIKEIYQKQVAMILINAHYVLTNPRPLLPSVVEVGGLHCNPAKKLPKEFEDYVSGANDGFIVFSTGSIITPSLMPESVRRAFVRTFAKLKQKVIWKWDKDEGMPDLPPNVKLVKWLPQQDLLGHPNIRLFITHGGLLSTEEAVFHGVPIIGLPVFVDQDANMQQAEIIGLGLKAEILDLTEEKLTPLVRKVLDDPRYLQKAKELSKIFRDGPQPALEKAIWNVEFTLRNKGAYHMRSSAIELNIFQYHCVDVVAFLVAGILTMLLFLYYVLRLVIRMIIRAVKTRNHQEKFNTLKRKKA